MVILSFLPLTGCDIVPMARRRQALVEEFHSTDIFQIPEDPRIYIVRSGDGTVWYVQLEVNTGKIWAKTQLFGLVSAQ